ncbi:hypothetical protein QAD02_018693 [Eretmocerus hayati]|uniref:Uncharacterized protein n=1 Tax=Eretmocerus hayati TaxID=131215 RepID=A0ACC2PJ91_9HYME|nr:hypothetical protein QAD02_018693 [Eretmocerus hayati]
MFFLLKNSTLKAHQDDEFLTTDTNWTENVRLEEYPYIARVITNCSYQELKESTGVIISRNFVLGVNSKPQQGCTNIVRIGTGAFGENGIDYLTEPIMQKNDESNTSILNQLIPFHHIILYKLNKNINYGARANAIEMLETSDKIQSGDKALSNGVDFDIGGGFIGLFKANIILINENDCKSLYERWAPNYISKVDDSKRQMGIFCSLHHSEQEYPGFSSTVILRGKLAGLRTHTLSMSLRGKTYVLNIYLDVTSVKQWIQRKLLILDTSR